MLQGFIVALIISSSSRCHSDRFSYYAVPLIWPQVEDDNDPGPDTFACSFLADLSSNKYSA